MIYNLKNTIFKSLFKESIQISGNNKLIYGEFSNTAKDLFNLRDANGGRGEASLAYDLLSAKPDLNIVNDANKEKSDKKILRLKNSLLDFELNKIPEYDELVRYINNFDLKNYFPHYNLYDDLNIENDVYLTTKNKKCTIKKLDNDKTIDIDRDSLQKFHDEYVKNINVFLLGINDILSRMGISEDSQKIKTKTQRPFSKYEIISKNILTGNKLFLIFFGITKRTSASTYAKNFKYIFLDGRYPHEQIKIDELTVDEFNKRFISYLIGSVRSVIEHSEVYENKLSDNPTYYFTRCITTGGKVSKSIDVQIKKGKIINELKSFFVGDDETNITIELKELNQKDFIKRDVEKTRNIGIRLASGSRQALLADDFLFYLVILGVLIKKSKDGHQYTTYKDTIVRTSVDQLKKYLVRFAFGEITTDELIFILNNLSLVNNDDFKLEKIDRTLFNYLKKKINEKITQQSQIIKPDEQDKEYSETKHKYFTSDVIKESINADYICLVAGITEKSELSKESTNNDTDAESQQSQEQESQDQNTVDLTDDTDNNEDQNYNKCKFIIFKKEDLLEHFVLSKISMGGTLYMNFSADVRVLILNHLFNKDIPTVGNTFLQSNQQDLELSHVTINKDKKLINEYKYLFKKEKREKIIYRKILIERLKNS